MRSTQAGVCSLFVRSSGELYEASGHPEFLHPWSEWYTSPPPFRKGSPLPIHQSQDLSPGGWVFLLALSPCFLQIYPRRIGRNSPFPSARSFGETPPEESMTGPPNQVIPISTPALLIATVSLSACSFVSQEETGSSSLSSSSREDRPFTRPTLFLLVQVPSTLTLAITHGL